MHGAVPVYIVHWNAPEWVASTCASFLASTMPVSVTVVDNGPYERELVLDPRVRVVRSGGNVGYAGGGNIGVADWLAGGAELCVIACHDLHLNTAALETIVTAAQAHPEYGVLAPTPQENVAGGPILARGEGVSDVSWASGTCLVLRRACIEQIGRFDEAFGSYGEDIDLCLRARDAGWKVGIVAGALAAGTGSVEPKFRTQMYVNQVRLRAKRAGALAAAKMLLAFPVLAVVDAVRGFLHRDETRLRRARGRIRAVPEAARLVLQRVRAREAATSVASGGE